MYFIDIFLKNLKKSYDSDWVDRLHSYWTPLVLVICATTLAAKQYGGRPIQCWVPATFTASAEEYVETHCFAKNTYFVKPKAQIPQSIKEREKSEIGNLRFYVQLSCSTLKVIINGFHSVWHFKGFFFSFQVFFGD
jgi:hypothetical protein